MARGETPYDLNDGDKVVFSARVIPEPTNEGQRYQAEKLLGMQGARVYSDIHVSGHLNQEGHYTMLDALQPQHVIPAHQDLGDSRATSTSRRTRAIRSVVTCIRPRTGTSSSSSARIAVTVYRHTRRTGPVWRP